jgi:hypothetical protein
VKATVRWTKERILEELRSISRRGQSLSYTSLAKRRQSLVSAAAYHFGSYRAAVEKAGLPYVEHLQRPRWTKQSVIAEIKRARRAGRDLHWGAVTARRDDLSRAARAAISKRLFGSWVRALHAAGVDSDDVAMYRRWDKHTIAFELRARAAEREPLNSGGLQKDDAGLHSACLRFFGSYVAALKAAGLDPDDYRQRKPWNRERVLSGLKKRAKKKRKSMEESAVRRDDAALHRAAVRHFGSFKVAIAAMKKK